MPEPDLTREQIENVRGFLNGQADDAEESRLYNALCDMALRASEARAQALEEAAKVLDDEAERFNKLIQHPETTSFGNELYSAYRDHARDCAAAIRALKDQSVSDAAIREKQ